MQDHVVQVAVVQISLMMFVSAAYLSFWIYFYISYEAISVSQLYGYCMLLIICGSNLFIVGPLGIFILRKEIVHPIFIKATLCCYVVMSLMSIWPVLLLSNILSEGETTKVYLHDYFLANGRVPFLMDYIQKAHQCCGHSSYTDYYRNPVESKETFREPVPVSCCSEIIAGCEKSRLIHKDGCFVIPGSTHPRAWAHTFHGTGFLTVMLLPLALPLFQLLPTCFLHDAIQVQAKENAKRRGNQPNADGLVSLGNDGVITSPSSDSRVHVQSQSVSELIESVMITTQPQESGEPFHVVLDESDSYGSDVENRLKNEDLDIIKAKRDDAVVPQIRRRVSFIAESSKLLHQENENDKKHVPTHHHTQTSKNYQKIERNFESSISILDPESTLPIVENRHEVENQIANRHDEQIMHMPDQAHHQLNHLAQSFVPQEMLFYDGHYNNVPWPELHHLPPTHHDNHPGHDAHNHGVHELHHGIIEHHHHPEIHHPEIGSNHDHHVQDHHEQHEHHQTHIRHEPGHHEAHHGHAPVHHLAHHGHAPTHHEAHHGHAPEHHEAHHGHVPAHHEAHHGHVPEHHQAHHGHTPEHHNHHGHVPDHGTHHHGHH